MSEIEPIIPYDELYRRHDGYTIAVKERIITQLHQATTAEQRTSLRYQALIVDAIEVFYGILQPEGFGESAVVADYSPPSGIDE